MKIELTLESYLRDILNVKEELLGGYQGKGKKDRGLYSEGFWVLLMGLWWELRFVIATPTGSLELQQAHAERVRQPCCLIRPQQLALPQPCQLHNYFININNLNFNSHSPFTIMRRKC